MKQVLCFEKLIFPRKEILKESSSTQRMPQLYRKSEHKKFHKILFYFQLQLRLSVSCKNKEINFSQDIGDSTSFDLLKLTKDGINDGQITMAVSQETHIGNNFLITFGCLVSADQPTINYKSRLMRKLTQNHDFSRILICHSIGLCNM